MVDDLTGIGKAASALSQPIQDFLNKLFGPATEETAELLADQVRYRRWKNSLSIIEKAQREIEKRGITPQKVPLKTLVPILEGASLESDDENLQAKWINLLASAASGNYTHPSYPKILSELVQTEAKLLDHLYLLEMELDLLRGSKPSKERSQKIQNIYQGFFLREIKKSLSFAREEFGSSINNLLRLQLCEHPEDTEEVEVITKASLSEENELDMENEYITNHVVNTNSIRLTVLGKNFMKACRGVSD
ncbi:MAG: hypothetical protein Kow00121_01090 [Elainellaceae cyanobacterium]